MEQIKKHFEQEAQEFDEIIRRLIPYYGQMLEALVSAVPFASSATIQVIDLGCGTGSVAKHVKDAFPRARITCVDLAENMLEMAKLKLGTGPGMRYQLADLADYEFDSKYDAIVSSLALHHLQTDDDKRCFYGKCHDGLAPGGVFFNADVILGSADDLQAGYMEKWRAFMRAHVAEEEIENKWIPKYYQEDRPASLMAQLSWLKQLGFAHVDVLWKYYNFAVYGGRKAVVSVRAGAPVGASAGDR